MKTLKSKSLLFSLIITTMACQSRKTEKVDQVGHEIISFFDDFEPENYDFIISSFDEGIERSEFKLNSSATFKSVILNQFKYPILLKQQINKGRIKESNTFSFQNKTYKSSDLFSLPTGKKDLYKGGPYQLDSIYQSILKEDSIEVLISGINSEQLSSKDLLSSMSSLTNEFQKTEISGFIRDTIFSNPNGNRFLQEIYIHGGWRVFIFDDQEVLWNYFEEGDNAVLMMNLMNQGIFAGMVYPKTDVISPFNNCDVDLLQSPIASKILRHLYCPTLKHINHANALSKKETVLKNRYHFLFAKELKSMAQNHLLHENDKKSKALLALHDKLFLNDIPSKFLTKEPLVKIDYVRNNSRIQKEFELEKDTIVRLFSSGHIISELAVTDRVKGRDFIDIFMVSPNNSAIRCWQSFYYHYLHPHGRKDAPMLFPFAYKDISSNSYQLEVKLPWSIINSIDKKKCPMKAIFSFNDSDMDPFLSESRISTTVDLEDLHCIEHNSQLGLKGIYAIRTLLIPKIDGESDGIWEDIPSQEINVVTNGKIENSEDASCSFKAMWDEENIYLLFTIIDQVKTYPYVIAKDFCRILNEENGNLLWQTSESESFPFYSSNHEIWLKKGKYILEYESDDYLSFSDWHSHLLPSSFYGAYLYID